MKTAVLATNETIAAAWCCTNWVAAFAAYLTA